MSPAPLRFRSLWLGLAWLLVLAVVVLSLLPHVGPETVSANDKLMHALAYGALALSFAGVLEPGRYGWLALALVGLGGGLELLQGVLPMRSAEWADALANAAGVALGLLLARAGLQHWCRWAERLLPAA